MDENETAVAIITRTKDRPLFLPRARESVSSQSFKDFVWVVVNDGGTTPPVDLEVSRAKKDGIDCLVIHREESQGMEAASNVGIRAVNSKYVVIHDDDDTWEPTFLEKTVAFLEANPQLVGVTAHSKKVIEKISTNTIVEKSRIPHNDWLRAVCISDLAVRNLYPPISFLFQRNAYENTGGFDESLPVLGDWDFNLRILLQGDIGVLPQMLAYHHVRPHITSRDDVYGNSVVAAADLHQFHDATYRNRKLREDIETGRLGLGHLLVMARMQILPYVTLRQIRSGAGNMIIHLADKLKHLLGKSRI